MQQLESPAYTQSKVFIVDDNPANTLMLKQVVEADSFESIFVYNDPLQALEAFYIERPQLVLLDLLMPKLSGIEFLRSISADVASADVAVIVLTACHDQAQRMQALELGAQDFIEKPINIIETLQRIKNVLNIQERKNTFQHLSEDLGGRLKTTRQNLSEVIATLNTIFDKSSEYVFVTDNNGVVNDSNKVAKQRFGIDGNSRCNLFERFNMDKQLLDAEAPELVLNDINNMRIIVEVSYSKVEMGRICHYVFIFKDITARKEDEINLKYLAETHYITHLPNRNQAHRLLSKKCKLLAENQSLSFIFMSFFDNNKVVEFYGHERLEYLLLNIALMLVEVVSMYDSVLIHWGDNDFLIVEESQQLAALLSQLELSFDKPIQISDGNDVGIYSKPTMGISTSEKDSKLVVDEFDVLVHNALVATYEAARLGVDRVHYDDKLNEKINYQAMIEKELVSAIENQDFKVAYQPKLDLKTDAIVSAEALIRWPHASFGMIPPATFIPIAESCGLVSDIGIWVLKQVLADRVKLREKYPTIDYVAINVAAPQLNYQLIELLQQLNDEADDNIAEFIELEITETSFIDDFARVGPILKQIKAMGFRLALDDFGTGYSSLSYLHELPVDTLKIDRNFITPILDSNRSLLLVKSIVSMSQALGMTVVAEGIEDENTSNIIRDLGVHQGQGFFYSKPELL